MTASAVRSYLNRYGVVGGNRVAIFGNNDDAFRTARDLAQAGVHISAYIDSRPDAQIAGDFPIYRSGEVYDTAGRTGLTTVRVRHDGGTLNVAADILGVSGGWNSNGPYDLPHEWSSNMG